MPLTPLATADQLAARLRLAPYAGAELDQVEALLLDASSEMRSIIGSPVTRLTSTLTLWPDRPGRVELPVVPVISIASVAVSGVELATTEWTLRYRTLRLPTSAGKEDEVTVTLTHGWDPIPDDIVKWTCVLAAAAKAAADDGTLGMTAGVVSGSEAIDDYQHSWQGPEASGGDGAAGMTLPPRIADRLRATYGGSGLIDWLEVDG
jgi:hypothetical protein